MKTINKKNIENKQFTLKAGSRIDNAKGYLITSKNYCTIIIRECRFNFVVINPNPAIALATAIVDIWGFHYVIQQVSEPPNKSTTYPVEAMKMGGE